MTVLTLSSAIYAAAYYTEPVKSSSSTSTGSSAYINTSLEAGNSSDVYIGFSSTEYRKGESQITKITAAVPLTLNYDSENWNTTNEITGSGEYYIYWNISRSGTTQLNMKWDRNSTADPEIFFVKHGENTLSEGTYYLMKSVAISGDTVSSLGTEPFTITTSDLRRLDYGKSYTVILTLEAVTK